MLGRPAVAREVIRLVAAKVPQSRVEDVVHDSAEPFNSPASRIGPLRGAS